MWAHWTLEPDPGGLNSGFVLSQSHNNAVFGLLDIDLLQCVRRPYSDSRDPASLDFGSFHAVAL